MDRDSPIRADWDKVRALFDAALAVEGDARAALLADPAHDAAVVAEVRSLLAHAAPTAEGVLARGAARQAPPGGRDRSGQRCGAWRIVEAIGTGGMGEVWLAERADGSFTGRAAVKVLRRGLDSDAVLARFALEQQALARLSHPNIAHLLDAGRTEDGLPYFVMAHVDGRPIDRACEGLATDARLALFLQLADAVAHAHRNLLLHRDLKPGNVLVDTAGQVKLLDFGIAKAIDPQDAAAPDQTLADARPFTPQYASPEQVRGEVVGTATDVYSLGVLLYRMLTGRQPYGRAGATPMEAARAVLEDEPQRPGLGSDLDNILLKALAKDIAQRYASVDAFAADVRAHRAGYPVAARAPTWGYRARRFVGRNRLGVALGAFAAVALVAGASLALWQARVADAQRDLALERFKQVRQLANQLVFKYHDQIENLPGATKVREALLTDAAAFLDGLDRASSDDPQLADELAQTHYRISRLQGLDASINTGRHDAAEVNLDKALALTRRYVDRPDTPMASLAAAISMHVSKGELLQRSGRVAQADAALAQGLPLLERALARDAKDGWALASAITLHGVRARILGSNLAGATLGRWQEACASADRARAAAEATIAADPANVYGPDSLAFTLGEQAQCQLLAGKAEAARDLLSRQVALRDQMAQKFPDDMDFRYQRAISRGNLARALSAAGSHAPARALLAEALGLARAAQAVDAGNQAGAERIDALEVTALQLDLAAGDEASARQRADGVIARLKPTPAGGFPTARARAEALLWAARAWHAKDARRALAFAHEAAALMQPAPSDDNVTRRWLLAQAIGEQAQALRASGDARSAAQRAAQALALWQVRPPAEGPPPAMRRWIDATVALAAP